MSRTPNSRKEDTHERILDVAARAIRRHGYAGVGVADVMKEAGLTHGGFYAHVDSRVALLVNGLGATPLEELYLLYRRCAKLIADEGLKIARSYVGEYVTSLEMAGASITVMLLDDELEALLEAPARSPFFRDGTES